MGWIAVDVIRRRKAKLKKQMAAWFELLSCHVIHRCGKWNVHKRYVMRTIRLFNCGLRPIRICLIRVIRLMSNEVNLLDETYQANGQIYWNVLGCQYQFLPNAYLVSSNESSGVENNLSGNSLWSNELLWALFFGCFNAW